MTTAGNSCASKSPATVRGGVTLCTKEKRMRCSYRTLRHRVEKYGWSVDKALTTPIRPKADSRWNHGA